MNSVYGWMLDSTPRRRELFKNARVTIGRPDSFVGLPSMPSLVVLHGIEPTTWNKSIQALFSTQNCDVMFTLCSMLQLEAETKIYLFLHPHRSTVTLTYLVGSCTFSPF